MQAFNFENAAGETLAGRLELPAGRARGVALFAHCFTCSKNVRAATQVSRALAQQGMAVLRFDFTGLGNSEGDFSNTNFSSNVDDLVAAADCLRASHGAPSLLVGHSFGGAAVLAAAARIPEVRGVATIGAPSEPAHVLHLLGDKREAVESEGEAVVELAGRPFRVKRQFLEDVTETRLLEGLKEWKKRALLVFHSPLDSTVDIDQARKIYQAAKHPKSFVSLDQADHLLSSVEDAEYVADVLSSWARRYICPADEATSNTDEGEVVVEEVGPGFANRVIAGRHQLPADEPVSVGGGDTGPTPYGYLLAALGTCTSMTLRMYANRKGWPLQGVRVSLRHSRVHAKDCEECETETGRVDRIDKKLQIDGPLDDDQRQRLLEIADRCPVHRTMLSETIIATELVG